MAYNKLKFDPEEGFLDSSFYEDTPENPRAILQRQHNQTRDYINSIVDTLNSSNEGSSGSESIMSPFIEGVNGNNVFEQIKDIKRQINDTAEGNIPDSSVSEAKIQNEAITNSKIKDGEISTEKLRNDLTAPFANDVININGKKASSYLPIKETGFSGGLKELFLKEPIKDIYGKIFNNKRYLIKDNFMHTLNLTDGTLEKIADINLSEETRFAVPDENTIIYTSRYTEDRILYFSIYKYDKKYEDVIKLGDISTVNSFFNPFVSYDIEADKDYLYIALRIQSQSLYYDYCYKIPFSEINETITPEVYFSCSSKSGDIYVLLLNNDLFFGRKILKNCSISDVIDIYSDILSCDTYGNILTANEYFPFCDFESGLPSYANMVPIEINGFVHDNYLYALIEQYIFRTKLNKEETI